ncbi:MAG: hypothetical protein CW341_00980 [Bacteroidetes bacterium]|nr:hypothetical protein [Bacteroidota bacterium]MBQ9509408.1 DUF819 family protein [Bacteroidales bacterium]
MNVTLITLVYILSPVIIILLYNKFDWAKKVGTVIMAYAVGIILALCGVIPTGEAAGAGQMKSISDMLMNITVPLAIPLMLFNSDFKLWVKSLPKTFVVLIGGLVAIVTSVILGYFVFRNAGIRDFGDVAAMMTGIYTGGTMNFSALGLALHVDETVMSIALTFEMLVTFPLIMFFVAGGYKLFRKLLPYKENATNPASENIEIKDDSFEEYKGMFSKGVFGKMMVGLLLSVLMLAVGAGLSLLTTGKLNELVIILTITTLAIAASFVPWIRNLPKTFELGMFFILIFSVVVASKFDIYSIDSSALAVMGFIAFIMLVALVIHLIICRIFKVEGDLFVVGQVGLLCSPPFIPPVVGAMGNRKVLISGIVIGLVGYAVGTYLGWLLSLLFTVI